MRHSAHEAARNFLDGFAEDIVNTNEADFENRLEEWTAQGFPELAFYRGDRPRDRGEIIAEIRKAQRALDGDERALAQATRDELPVLAGALRVAARSLTDGSGGQVLTVDGTDEPAIFDLSPSGERLIIPDVQDVLGPIKAPPERPPLIDPLPPEFDPRSDAPPAGSGLPRFRRRLGDSGFTIGSNVRLAPPGGAPQFGVIIERKF